MNTQFTQFIDDMTKLVGLQLPQNDVVMHARKKLADLVKTSTWLPAEFKQARPDRYAQYLLHKDPQKRFSVVSFVWDTGHQTPIHNHTVWGLVGVLEGAECCEEYALLNGQPTATGHTHVMNPGDVEAVYPPDHDWHKVSNALGKGVTVSIHVYGADIGEVQRYKLDASGNIGNFVSGYDVPGQLHA
jgi:3-mercaptopropionate dioxygenase